MNKKLVAVITSVALMVAMIPSLSFAGTSADTVNIPVAKTWDDSDNQDQLRPDTLNVYLKSGNETLASTQLTKSGNFEGSFSVEKKDLVKNGSAVTLTVAEDEVEGYEMTDSSAPSVSYEKEFKCSNGFNRITPCNELSRSNSFNIVAVKVTKGGNLGFLWTAEKLTDSQVKAIWEKVQASVKGMNNTSMEGYVYGDNAQFRGITVSSNKITFSDPSDWALYGTGSYEFVEKIDVAGSASLKNTHEVSEVVEEEITEEPEPEEEVIPEEEIPGKKEVVEDDDPQEEIIEEEPAPEEVIPEEEIPGEKEVVEEETLQEEVTEEPAQDEEVETIHIGEIVGMLETEFVAEAMIEGYDKSGEEVAEAAEEKNAVSEKAAPEKDKEYNTPKTGDMSYELLALMLTALAGLVVSVILRRKTN